MLTTTAVLGTVGIGVMIWASTDASKRSAIQRTAQAYFKANAHQFRQDLNLGAGYTIEDLATAAEIRREHLARFGQVLHRDRADLLAMAEPSQLTEERAGKLLQRIGEIAGRDALLASDRDAFVAHQGDAGLAKQ